MGAPNYITDNKGNIVYPRTLAKCVKKGGTTLDDYLDKVEDNLLIKPTAQGTDIQLKDSSDMNIQELHLLGKTEQKTTNGVQLFNINDRLTVTISTFSPIYNISEDGYITANIPLVGTEKYYNFFTKPSSLLKINKEYSAVIEIVDNPLNLRVTAISVQENIASQFSNNVFSTQVGTNITKVTTIDDFSKAKSMCRGYIYVPANISGTVKFRVSIIEGTSVTASNFKYEPYTGGQPSPSPDYPQEIESVENPVIKIAGKNLLDCSNKEFSTKCYINEKANILGRALQNNYELGYCFPVTQGKYNISASTNFRTAFSHKKLDENANETINVSGVATTKAKATIEAKEDGYIYVCNSTDFYKNEKKLMISKMEANEYEEYKEIQSAQQTCELKGIGDVKDELIIRSDGTGQLVQKIKSYDCSQISRNLQQSPNKEYYYLPAIDKSTTNASRVLSTHFTSKTFDKKWGNVFKVNGNFYFGEKEAPDNISDKNAMKQWLIGNKVKILFQLEEPIITELSSEEVQKILALHTNKPNTTIWNDQNADMQITYIADTKKYIDDKFEELSEAITTSTTINSLDTSN